MRRFADLTDVTLTNKDTNSILTDNANRALQGNVAMKVTSNYFCHKNDLSYKLNTLGPLCLWQCLVDGSGGGPCCQLSQNIWFDRLTVVL